MGFKFTLQAVREHRQTVEEKLQREYSEALGQLEAIRQQQRDVETDISRCIAEVRRKQACGLNFAEWGIYEHWIDEQHEQVERLLGKAEQMAKEVEVRRLKLVKAVQDRTIMDKLRSSELKAYRKEEGRVELRLFDEIAVRDYVRAQHQEKDAGFPERIAG